MEIWLLLFSGGAVFCHIKVFDQSVVKTLVPIYMSEDVTSHEVTSSTSSENGALLLDKGGE